MFKKILYAFVGLAGCVSVSAAGSIYYMDTPTPAVLNYGSYDVSFRFYSGGSEMTRLDFGVFKFMNLGIAWELGRLIGNENVEVAIPALSVKVRLYEGNMTWPAIALGYDGQGYFFNQDYDGDYVQRGKGVYLVIGRELFVENLNLNVGLNINDFHDVSLHGFIAAGIPVPFAKDTLLFMAEYDNIGYFPDARLNFGLKLNLVEYIDVSFMMRDCWGKDNPDRFPNERVFKVGYSGKF